ncbi:MAG: Uma2 family endonuclease [Armatimonadota bacterium]|nr:Uma2 family endonuclease [Armatimonadota bacterium]MDR7497148.1 Uma2 family endonuclease [Armatimonadota bacterium]MDR7512088.1 Uma2 family endonuclease [Armatimonadota bacterium]
MGVRIKAWTREEYHRLAAAGVFAPGARVQLVRGEIVETTPQSAAHATAVRLIQQRLEAVFREGYDVRAQLPLALSEDSEPEPDVAVVPGTARDYSREHPTSAVLVVEVAAGALRFDQGPRATMYAQAGVREYWILDLERRVLEVHRHPRPSGYAAITVAGPGEAVAPEAVPDTPLHVADLLP